MEQNLVRVEKQNLEFEITETIRVWNQFMQSINAYQKRVKQLRRQAGESVRTVWHFHTVHGANVRLSGDQKTAERNVGAYNSIVFSNKAVKTGKLYEVQLQVDEGLEWSMSIRTGVTGWDPEMFINIPDLSEKLPSSLVIRYDSVWFQGQWRDSSYGQCLRDVRTGSRVGILLDSQRHLHLYVNGVDQGCVPWTVAVPQPCWAVFDAYVIGTKLTALPGRTVC